MALIMVPLAGAVSETSVTANASPAGPAPSAEEKGDLYSDLNVKVEHYNQNFDNVPMLVKRLVGSQEIEGKITQNDGSVLRITALMRGGKVGEFYKSDTKESRFGPSLTFESDEDTIRKIMSSKDPLRKTVRSIKDGKLKVECESFFRKSVLWAIEEIYS